MAATQLHKGRKMNEITYLPEDWQEPKWAEAGKCRDWRSHIRGEVRAGWMDFSEKQKAALVRQAEETVYFQEQLIRQIEVMRHKEEEYSFRLNGTAQLLAGIHSLLYPAPIKMADGRTMVFRPTDPDPHTILQMLSDRIRALPDELAKLQRSSMDAPL
jgi:hypothetical protein